MRLRHTFAILLIALCFPAALAADIGISPPRLDLVGEAGERLTATVTVITSARTEQQIAAEIGDWTMDLHGEMAFFPAGSLAYSASGWLELDADAFVLVADASREVRLEVAIPPNAEGTFQAMAFFTVVPPPTEGSGIGVVTTTRVGLTVYVTVAGTERAGADLIDLYQSGERTLTAAILNGGNTVMRLGGVVELRDETGEVVRRLEVPDVPVLRESERELTFTLPDDLPSGFYVALALIEDSRGGVLAGELAFDIP
jgi:hypothetical protein